MIRFSRTALLIGCALSPFFVSNAEPKPSVDDLQSQLTLAADAKDVPSQIELLRRLLERNTDDGKLRAELVTLCSQLGDSDLAIATLDQWPGKPPASLTAITRAKAAAQAERPDEAIQILTDHLATEPDDVPALALLASLQSGSDRLATLDRLVGFARNSGNLIARANARRDVGDYTGAIADASAASRLDPEWTGVAQFERLEIALAQIKRLDAALAKKPGDLTTLLLRAYYYDFAGISNRSLADANAALAVAPDSLFARIAADRANVRLGKLDYDVARERDSVVTEGSAASAEAAAGLIDADVKALDRPDDVDALTNLAHKLGGENNQDLLVVITADRALAIQPDDRSAALLGIASAIKLGDLDDASARLRNFEATDPPSAALAPAYGDLARAYFARSELPLALAFADNAIAQDSTPEMIQIKAGCLQRLGRGTEAQALLDQ